MAILAEAYDAVDAGMTIKHLRQGSTSTALLDAQGRLRWQEDDVAVAIDNFMLDGWIIEDPEPDYIDCPIEWHYGIAYFWHGGLKYTLDQAPRFELIGYVYEDSIMRDTPTTHRGSHGPSEVDRLVAVRIEK